MALFCFSLVDNGRGPSYPSILSDLGIDTAKGSYLFSIASFIGIIVNVFSSWWLPKFGPVVATRLSLFLLGMTSFVMYISYSLKSYFWLLFASVILGLALAILTITVNILVTNGSPVLQVRKYLNGLHSVYGVSSLSAPFILSLFFKYNFSWGHYYLILSSIPILILLFTLNVKRIQNTSISKAVFKGAIPLKPRVIFGFLFGFYISGELLISSRIVYILKKNYGFSEIDSNNGLMIFFLLLFLGRLFFMIKEVKIDSKKILISSSLVSLLLSIISINGWPYALAFCGLSFSCFFPVATEYLGQRFSKNVDYMIASSMTWAGPVVAFFHWAFGQAIDMFGIFHSMFIIPFIILSTLILTLMT